MRSQAINLDMKTRDLHLGKVELKRTRSRVMHLDIKTRGLHLSRAYALLSYAPRHEEPTPWPSLCAPEPCTSLSLCTPKSHLGMKT
ncbi:hypothetical protein B296_00021566 [Ensete ventricosum]|uniref:Uncharacterized protein n=1 Tax=Ensete ventricosum TaxID=4639 RepID=A0A426XSA5_ENSVE|nr:hypothetical protein B296_00021566 [Ensete ventricosum]